MVAAGAVYRLHWLGAGKTDENYFRWLRTFFEYKVHKYELLVRGGKM